MKKFKLIGLIALPFLVLLIPTVFGIFLIHEPETLDKSSSVANANGENESEESRIDVMRGGVPFAINNGETVKVDDNFLVKISVDPYPPVDFDSKLYLTITNDDGTTIEDAEISIYYDMLYMFHGWNESHVQNLGNGEYEIDFDFFMFGAWTLDTYIELSNEQGEISIPIVLYIWPT